MTGKWLEALGLTESDVRLINIDQPSALVAFDRGVADAMALWAPFTYTAKNRGHRLISNAYDLGAITTSMYVIDRAWADRNPELVAKFLRVHYRVVDVIRAGITPELVKEYQKYMNDFCGLQLSEADARADLESKTFWNFKETLEISDSSKGISQAFQWQLEAAQFFTRMGRFTQAEYEHLRNGGSFTEKFLHMLK